MHARMIDMRVSAAFVGRASSSMDFHSWTMALDWYRIGIHGQAGAGFAY